MSGIFWDINISLEVITLILSLIMLFNFFRGLRGIRSAFTFGLTIISCVFALQAGFSIYAYTYFSRHYSLGLSLPLSALSMLELMGVATLLYLSYK
jgi:uncharacterized membrane-anchored protein